MKYPQVCNFMNSYSNCSQLSCDFISGDPNFWLKYMKLGDSRNNSRIFESVQYNYIYSDGVKEIFSVIDRSKLIVCGINRQHVNIKRLNISEYKTPVIFEKIKLIDLVKLLIISRKDINLKLTVLENNNSYYLKEVTNQISGLDEACKFCVEFPINENEITSDFGLSTDVVDSILNDCGLDLFELDKFVSDKIKELGKKLNLMKNSHQSKIQKSRIERYCEKILLAFQNEVCTNLNCIHKILDRLFSGHSNFMIDPNFFRLSSDELQEYHCEINQYQLHKIINLKYFLLEIDEKVTENIFVIKEFQMMLTSENIVHSEKNSLDFLENILSPIRKSSKNGIFDLTMRKSFLSSTPGSHGSSRNLKLYSILSESKETFHDLNEESISSFDSGYLLTSGNEHSLRDSCDNFDVIPFSDDEYEKITDDDEIKLEIEEDSDLCESMCTTSENEISVNFNCEMNFNSFNIIPSKNPSPVNLDFDSKEFCYKNKFCQNNSVNKFLFSSSGYLNIFGHKVFTETPLITFKERIDFMSLLEFDCEMINNLELSDNDIRHKISMIIIHEELELKFNWILRMTILRTYQNPFDDINDVLEYLVNMVTLYKICNLINFESKSDIAIQLNNSAHNPYIICKTNVIKNDEQNTNNNADSKDDDSNDFSTTQNDSINNDSDSLCLDAELHVAFKNILFDSTSIDHNVDVNEVSNASQFNDEFNSNRDATLNVNTTISDQFNAGWHDTMSIHSDILFQDYTRNIESEFIEDIELMVKLSEIHLRSEFQSEQHNKSTMINDKNRIVNNYKNLTSKFINSFDNNQAYNQMINLGDKIELNCAKTIVPEFNEGHVLIQTISNINVKNQSESDDTNYCDTLEEINEEMKPEFFNNVMTEFSLDSQKHGKSVESMEYSTRVKKVIYDDESMSCCDRISLTINLTEKLLGITNYQLNFISSLYNKKITTIKSTIMCNKSLSICALRQRLNTTIKILTNLKFAIQNAYRTDIYNQLCSEIDKLIDQSENLTQLSIGMENRMKKNGCEMEKIDCYNFELELPDNLLIKIEPNDVEMILAISTRRLQITIAALSRYPCYNYFQKLHLPRADKMLNNSISLNYMFENGLNPSDLLQKLCKLRRITAICALNIVDLHVVLTKLESDGFSEHHSIEEEVKTLLIFWRTVDGECHRLLRCTSLVHHIMTDTRKAFIDLVSLIAVMHSLMRTVELSNDESNTMKTYVESLMNYKQRILEWLEEVRLCVSVIYKKRMTNKRFKYYDDIHNFLEENLNTISELTNTIKNGYNQAVSIVSEVMTYCSNLPNCSISEIGKLLITDEWVNNEHLYYSESNNDEVNENIFNAIIDLEELIMRINNSITNESIKSFSDQFQEFLSRSKDILQVINDENSDLISEKNNSSMIPTSLFSNILNKNQIFSEDAIVEKGTEKIINKISKMAAYVATNALLLFVDKYKLELYNNNDKEHQISNLSCISDNDFLQDLCSRIIENVSATLTLSIIENILDFKRNRTMLAAETVLRNLCRELSDRTVFCLVEQMSIEQEVVDEMFLSDTSTDISNYLYEELGCLLVNSSLEELQIADIQTNNNIICNSTCVSKFQEKLISNLIQKAQVITSDFVDSQLDLSKSVQLSNSDFWNPDFDYEFSKELSGFLQNCLHNVPISSLKQTYDSHEVFKSFTRLFDSNLIVANQHVRKMTNISNLYKCIANECEVCKPPLTEINFSKHKSNRISKLVAHFNQNIFEKITRKKSPRVKQMLERIFLNVLNIKSIQMVEEIVKGVLQDFRLYSAIPQNIETIEIEKSTRNSSNIEKSVISGLFSKDPTGTSIIQVDSSEVLPFCDTKTKYPVKICPILVYNSDDTIQELSKFQSIRAVNEIISNTLQSENIDFTGLKSTDSLSKIDICKNIVKNSDKLCFKTIAKEKMFTSFTDVIAEHTETIIENYTLSRTIKSSNSASCHSFFDVKDITDCSLSSNLEVDSNKHQDFYCGTMSFEEVRLTDEIYTDIVTDTETSKLQINNIKAENKIFNVGENENQSCYNDELIIPLQSVTEKMIKNSLLQKEKDVSIFNLSSKTKSYNLDRSSVKRNRCINKRDFNYNHQFVESYSEKENNLRNAFSNSSQLSSEIEWIHKKKFSRLWIFIVILILILAITLFSVHLSQFCNCLSSFGQSFYPKITSNGLPF